MIKAFATATVTAFLVLAAIPAAADGQRYVLQRVEGGFIRMDTATGAMAQCSPQDGIWHCRSLTEEGSDPSRELAALKAENADLKARLAKAEAKRRHTLNLPSDADIDRLMSVFEKMMRRFKDFARSLDQSGRSDI